MPVYLYERSDGVRFEWLQGVREMPLKRCPTTGKRCRRIVARFQGRVAPHLTDDAMESNARQRQWIENDPDVQAGLKSGKYDIDTSKGDND